MLLIDAHNIMSGGGIILLDYFIVVLEQNNKNYYVIKNTNVTVKGDTKKQINCPSPWARRKTLRESFSRYKPDTILCFGNYPPQDKFPVRTITYFHNSYLICNWYTVLREDKLVFFRQKYLSANIKNTDYFLFQNSRVKEEFIKFYGNHSHLTYWVIPIFDENKILVQQKNESLKKNQFIYISLPYRHKNHLYLLTIWSELQKIGYNPVLLLTIPEVAINKKLLSGVKEINTKGGRIINLGVLPYDEILRHTAESTFCIYPSLLESFGLGLIEGALLGCKVIAAKLPYTEAVIEPSLYFDPYSLQSGLESVLSALKNEDKVKATVPVIQNRIGELLEML
jgi:glycosyltransferase involved in cell wall biosynthesis